VRVWTCTQERCWGIKQCPVARWDKNGETLMRGRRWVCQNLITDRQKDGRNRGGFLYSDRKIDGGREAVRCQPRGWGEGGVDVAVTEQPDEDQEGGERRMCGGR